MKRIKHLQRQNHEKLTHILGNVSINALHRLLCPLLIAGHCWWVVTAINVFTQLSLIATICLRFNATGAGWPLLLTTFKFVVKYLL